MTTRIIGTALKDVSPSLRELLAKAKANPPTDVENTKPAHIFVTVGELIDKLQQHDPSLVVYVENRGEVLHYVDRVVRIETYADGMGVARSRAILQTLATWRR